MKTIPACLLLTLALGITADAADETAARLNRAAAIFAKMTESEHRIRPERMSNADCIAVIPGFKKGAAGVGVGFGRGFISCRKDGGWSAPAAISLETASIGVQLGGEEIDIVVLSLDKSRRARLLADRFTVGSDASAPWGNGKSVHEDPNAQVVFYGQTKGVFAGFGLCRRGGRSIGHRAIRGRRDVGWRTLCARMRLEDSSSTDCVRSDRGSLAA
jgi:lipid-binding SYLF domain-containing protein